MKLLYIARHRRDAEVAAHALRGIAPNVTLAWAHTVNSARRWVQDNPDAAAILVDDDGTGEQHASFVQQARDLGLGLTIPVVVGNPDHLGALLAALRAGLHAIVDRERTRCVSFEAKLAEAEVGRQEALQRLADVQTQHKASLARDGRICTALQARLLELEGALRDAEQRRTSDASAAADHLTGREAELGAALAEAMATTRALESRLSEAEAAHQGARRIADTSLAAARERQAALADQLAGEASVRAALEHRLVTSEASRQDADRRHAAELANLAGQLSTLQAHHDATLTESAAARAAFEDQLADAASALEAARQQRASEATVAAERLARREAELGEILAESAAARAALEHTFTEAEAAHQHAQGRAAADLAGAAEREAALETRLAYESSRRATLEQSLAAAEAERQDADRRHAAELAQMTMRLADAQTRYDNAVAEHGSTRTALEQQLVDATAGFEAARQERASETAAAAERLARREAELGAVLAESANARTALEHALTEAEAAHQHAQRRAAADLAAAAERQASLEARLMQESTTRATLERHAAEREAELRARLDHQSTMRTALERDLAETRTSSARARRRLIVRASALRRRTREHYARLEAQLRRERADWERGIAARDEESRQIQQHRETLQLLLATTEEQVHTLESVAHDHASQRARLERVVADRDAQLSAQMARHLAAERTAEETLAQVQESLRVTREAGTSEIARAQREVDLLRRELEATRTRNKALRDEAERVPVLQIQLDESQKENRRQFDRAPYGLCQCTREGRITRLNHSLARLLGYRKPDDLRRVDFATAVFECADDLRWLIERSVGSETMESVETTWKTRDRRRLFVRLHALTTTTGSVAIAVEDITNLRAVEQRLRQAQRMEAVGRLASEVAVTCDMLLRDVTQGGQQWLAEVGGDAPLRRQGELLLGEVSRAAGFLRQFAVYGHRETSALEPVSVQRVLRDLEPVLKRVAGDDIKLVLPKSSEPFEVDVEAERIERILVNVANYARERMPNGGRVKIDLATTVADRRFIASYPNVRPGAHVLITVTEVPGAVRPALPIDLRADVAAADASRSASDKPGVDLGALLALVGDLGGHLWMAAEPSGNMTLKIHLPKPASNEVTDSASPAARSDRGRPLARWFRH